MTRTVDANRRIQGGSAAGPVQLRALTGLRGIAAWWVVLYHFREYFPQGTPARFLAFCGQGFLAVDLFFVLSGFIIAYNYLPTFSTFHPIAFLRFLGIRLARIYPLHLFMLLLFLLNPIAIVWLSSHGLESERYDPSYYVMSLFLVQNWGFSRLLAWNVPAWSISTEWMAYLLFPLFAWLAKNRANSTAYTLAGLVTPLVLLGCGLMFMSEHLGTNIPKNGLIRCLCEFASGVFVYRLWMRREIAGRTCVLMACVLGALVAAYFLTDISDIWVLPAMWVCAIYLLANEPPVIALLFSNRFAEIVGLWSYSTYLVHYFVRDWVKFLLIHDSAPTYIQLASYLAATTAASGLLYFCVEIPGRRLGRRIVDRFGSVRAARL